LSQPLNIDKGEHNNEQVIGIPDKFWSTDTPSNVEPIVVRATSVVEITDRAKIIAEYHDSPLAGHPGKSKTIKLFQRDFTWDSLEDEV
jgi:hypothetical protein